MRALAILDMVPSLGLPGLNAPPGLAVHGPSAA